MSRQRTVAIQLHRSVQCRLSAQSWQNGVRFFAFHDRLDHFRSDRLDIRTIREFWIGHDGGRVGIHQHDHIAFLAQCLARLHAGIIKFATLSDYDWTGADQQNFLELVISRHLRRWTLDEIIQTSREKGRWPFSSLVAESRSAVESELRQAGGPSAMTGEDRSSSYATCAMRCRPATPCRCF